ncbi:MAG: aminotransferase class I/II-fold pyridoxal phosphate-dependent enzyme [Ruminococcaceae bacterium]|nr:aminotransferase class I/II-fold pyridoxal phosphate-dependent enzyme [Oscillospiraceae bacterium]
MKTPICDFIDGYLQKDSYRLHMPGHKGAGGYERDITEIPGADVLYSADGIIRESQEAAAKLFGSGKTLYSTEGASLAIRGMLTLLRLYAGPNCRIAAGRNAHKTFVTAAALLGLSVSWLWPEEDRGLLSCQITPQGLERFLSDHPVDAVYLTSPDYLGNMAPIRELSQVCHAHKCLLLVDNAHGAYLAFTEPSLHPMAMGADLCCDSAHKTLPVLTGGAYLHIRGSAPEALLSQAETAMAMFASTSPSYLILESLDRVNPWLEGRLSGLLSKLLPRLDAMKARLVSKGYRLAGNEPMKLTLAPKSLGYTGQELAEYLRAHRIEPEYADPDHVVLMPGAESSEEALAYWEEVLLALSPRPPIPALPPKLPRPQSRIPMDRAILSPGRELPLSQCLGKCLASPTVSCPPAVPVLVCGEQVDEACLEALGYYGIGYLNVILEESL